MKYKIKLMQTIFKYFNIHIFLLDSCQLINRVSKPLLGNVFPWPVFYTILKFFFSYIAIAYSQQQTKKEFQIMFLYIFQFIKYFNCYKRYTTSHLSHIYIFISYFSNISIDQHGWEIVDYLEISDNDIVL